jgi:hypothetical protein
MLIRLWNLTPVALKAAVVGALVVVTTAILGVTAFRTYGFLLFLGAPFVMGFTVGYFLSIWSEEPESHAFAALSLAFLLGGGLMVMVAFEGAVCLVMAAPLAIPLAVAGSTAGLALAGEVRKGPLTLGLMLLPLGWGVEAAIPPTETLHEVRSAIEIDAAPEAVWPHVLAFPPLPEPTEWWFEIGLAYPREARIEGQGVGAIRYCVFSTGPFVEPITAWEPAKRLAFDVIEAPAPLRELSPWNHVHPPHLDGYLNSRRGEFRLVALPNGRARLEGSTWYQLDMAPAPYWRWVTDNIIGRIHDRVLGHIKTETERAR